MFLDGPGLGMGFGLGFTLFSGDWAGVLRDASTVLFMDGSTHTDHRLILRFD